MPTRAISPVPAGRVSQVTPGGGPARAVGPVSTAAGQPAAPVFAEVIGVGSRGR